MKKIVKNVIAISVVALLTQPLIFINLSANSNSRSNDFTIQSSHRNSDTEILGYTTSAYIDENNYLYMSGDNEHGELGLGSAYSDDSYDVPILVRNGFSETKKWNDVSLGNEFTLAIDENDHLYAWGNNNHGQLGDSATTVDSDIPLLINDEKTWVGISAGDNHSLAVTDEGDVYAWGLNDNGQLGNSNKSQTNYVPTQITTGIDTEDIVSVHAGKNNSAAVTSNGDLYTWGNNDYGQLVNSNTNESLTPILVYDSGDVSNSNIIDVSLANDAIAVVNSDGELLTAGSNEFGQSGDKTPDLNEHSSFTAINPIDVDFSSVELGYDHAVALTTDESIYSWGKNEYNQVNEDSTTAPRVISLLEIDDDDTVNEETISSIAVGYYTTLVKTTESERYVFGDNNFGQLATPNSSVPIPTQLPASIAPEFDITPNVITNTSYEFTVIESQTNNSYSSLDDVTSVEIIGGSSANINSSTPDVWVISFTGLTSNTNYDAEISYDYSYTNAPLLGGMSSSLTYSFSTIADQAASAPTGLVATSVPSNPNQLQFKFTYNQNDETGSSATYDVSTDSGVDKSWTNITNTTGTLKTDGTESVILINGLSSNTAYFVRVNIVTDQSNNYTSETDSATTTQREGSSTPTNLVVVAPSDKLNTDTLDVSYKYNSNDDTGSTAEYFITENNSNWGSAVTPESENFNDDGSTSTATFDGLNEGTDYYVRVLIKTDQDTSGITPVETIVPVSTNRAGAQKPKNLIVNPVSNERYDDALTLDFNYDGGLTNNPDVQYSYRVAGTADSFTIIGSEDILNENLNTDGTNSSVLLTGFEADTRYEIKISITNDVDTNHDVLTTIGFGKTNKGYLA